jgi:hypothetical protein
MDRPISEIFEGNRRRVLRRQVRLAASVSVIERDAPADSPHRPLTVLGYTRDISADGLALIVPSTGMGGGVTEVESHMLRIILALPLGDVALSAVAVHQKRLDDNSPDIGFLIGARITEMGAGERDLYLEYLRTLGGD